MTRYGMSTLDRIELLNALAPELRNELSSQCSWLRFAANELVVDYDDTSSDVYFVLSGQVRVLYRAVNGKELILGELGAGSLFGEIAALDERPRSANVTTLAPCEMCLMPAATFVGLLDRAPELKAHLLRLLAGRIRDLNARLAEYGFLQARHRLYAELLRLSRPRKGHDGQRLISPPPFQHDLANRVGTRREVVSRELTTLARQGLVERTRGALVLVDPGELNRRISAALDS